MNFKLNFKIFIFTFLMNFKFIHFFNNILKFIIFNLKFTMNIIGCNYFINWVFKLHFFILVNFLYLDPFFIKFEIIKIIELIILILIIVIFINFDFITLIVINF